MRTQGDKDVFILRQESALQMCSKRGDTLVEMIDNYVAQLAPPAPWYKFWERKK